MYKCEHFLIQELVDPDTYKLRKDKAWELLDDRLLITLDRLREKYGSITVNNWKWGKDRKWSCLRNPNSPEYSTYSQHTYGRAADCLFNDTTAEQVRQDILASQDKIITFDNTFEYINSIELDVSWLHFDVRNCEPIKAFKP